MTVVKFPAEKVYPRMVEPREIYAQEEPPDEMVWAVCPYMRQTADYRCLHCPKFEHDEHYGPVQRGCYGIAAEACRIVFAMQKRAQP